MGRIQDYAIIGDGRSAALVSRAGAIDWLCWPRFDSPSIFGALLGPEAGSWRIAPVAGFETSRAYLDQTNVLQTRFRTARGDLLLTDLMPVATQAEHRRCLFPEHELLRVAECEAGEVELDVQFVARPGYGGPLRSLRKDGFGWRMETRKGLLMLRSDVPLTRAGDALHARVRLRAGERAHFSLTLAVHWPAVFPPLVDGAQQAIARTVAWWRRWCAQLRYDGPERDAVVRSALALKLLVYAPSGAVIAAPTTSLPERPGGPLNWDYRYCWLRDAALTVRALFGLGFAQEADAFVSWLLHATRLTRPELRVLYDVFGRKPPPERLVDLPGFEGARPVRVGNAAADQLQLDVYGEVIDAAAHFVRHGGTLDLETQRMLGAFGEYICHRWPEPDEGIWEPRSGKKHRTHSRVLAWVALDRLLRLHRAGHLRRLRAERFERNRELIRSEVETRGWSEKLGSYVAWFDGEELDAALLLLPWYGYTDASSERMRRTYARILERLGAGEGLLYRYRDPDSAGEGAFGIASFWGAEYLALGGGTLEEAEAAFGRLVRLGNDVGLFAEEIDPRTHDALGNFPQAFTHVGLINAALSLARRREGRAPIGEAAKEVAR